MKKIFMIFALVSAMGIVASDESAPVETATPAAKVDYVAQAKDKAVAAKAYVSGKAQVLATKLYPTKAVAVFQEKAASNPVATLLVVAASAIVLKEVVSYTYNAATEKEEELV